MRALVCCLALGAAALAGCISERSGVGEQSHVVWQTGVTTRRDVVSVWGNPDVVSGDVWIWRGRRMTGGKVKVSFMEVGATVKNLALSAYEYRLTFGPDGRLATLAEVDYTPGTKSWSINPWE